MPLAITATPDPATGRVRLDCTGLALYRKTYLEKVTPVQLGTWTRVTTDTTVVTSGNTGLATWTRSAASELGRIEQDVTTASGETVTMVARLQADTWPTKVKARAAAGTPRLGALFDAPLEPYTTLAPVVALTNLATNPRAAGAGGWTSNGATWTVANNVAVPAPHPAGITTASRSTLTAANATLGSWYNIDGQANSATVRGVGVWVWSAVAGSATLYMSGDQAGTIRVQPVAAATWTWVTTAAPGSLYAILQVSRTGTGAIGDQVYATGAMALAGAVPSEAQWFDGAVPDSWDGLEGYDYAWTGTAHASTSTATVPASRLPDGMTLRHNWALPATTHSCGIELWPLSPFQSSAAIRLGFVGIYDTARMQDPVLVRSDGYVVPLDAHQAHTAMRSGSFTAYDRTAPLGPVSYTLTDTFTPSGGSAATATSATVTLTLPAQAQAIITTPDTDTELHAPALVLDYAAGGAPAGAVQGVLDRDDPIWIGSTGTTRSGTLELFFLDYAPSLAMLRRALAGDRLQLRQTLLPGLDMTFVPTRASQGRASGSEDLETPPWVVTIDYQEVLP